MTWYQEWKKSLSLKPDSWIEAFNIFSMETQSEEYRREQINVLCNRNGNRINDVYQGDSTTSEAFISTLEQEVEFQDFFFTFDEVVK